jgi:hypothetical protein
MAASRRSRATTLDPKPPMCGWKAVIQVGLDERAHQRWQPYPIERSFNDFVGPNQNRLRNCDAKVSCGFEVHG